MANTLTFASEALNHLARRWQERFDQRLLERLEAAGDRITWARYEPLPSPVVSQEGPPMMPKDLLDDLEVGDAERAMAMMKAPVSTDPVVYQQSLTDLVLQANGLAAQNAQQSMQNAQQFQNMQGGYLYVSSQQIGRNSIGYW